MIDSLRYGTKKLCIKCQAQKKSEENDIYSKSIKRLEELFGLADQNDDGVQGVPMKSSNGKLPIGAREPNDHRKKNVSVEEIGGTGITCPESTSNMDMPYHSKTLSTDISGKANSIEFSSKKEPVASVDQDQPPDDSTAKTDSSQQQQLKSPNVVVFSNKYNEYIVENTNETETTIYVIRKKKNKKRITEASTSV